MGKKQKLSKKAVASGRPKEVFVSPTIFDVTPQIQTLASCARSHRILLIGEGDFSFALGLALSLGGSKLTATSFDSFGLLTSKYPDVKPILSRLKATGASVYHGLDGTQIMEYFEQKDQSVENYFDRIVFNFPHLGGALLEDVAKNQEMLRSFFASASRALKSTGEIHVALRNTPFYESWNIHQLAGSQRVHLQRVEPFLRSEIPGYEPRRTHPAMRGAASTDNASRHVFSLDLSDDKSQTLASARTIPEQAKAILGRKRKANPLTKEQFKATQLAQTSARSASDSKHQCQMHCKACRVSVQGVSRWNAHLNSSKHSKAVKLARQSANQSQRKKKKGV